MNPSIQDLKNQTKYELVAELHHNQIKEFVINQISEGSKITRWYMIYQLLMIIPGIFFMTRSIVLAFHTNLQPLYFTLSALVFCFSLLIVLHEFLHGMAIKLTGAPKVNYGAYFKKFIFYAEADQHVLNRRQFAFIALTPLVFIQIITVLALVFLKGNPAFYFPVVVMSAHSLFCAGDIALLSVFYQNPELEMYTFDVNAKKTSYYYQEKKGIDTKIQE